VGTRERKTTATKPAALASKGSARARPTRGAPRDFKEMERRRMRAGRMFERGKTQAEVVRALGVSRPSVSRWYKAWRKGGAKALAGAGRAGRRPRLSEAERRALDRALLKGPLAHGFPTDVWTLKRVGIVIKRITGVDYHTGHVWKILRSMDWSLQRPARRAVERDEEAIARWVKNRWPQVKKTPAAGGRGSSSATSRASA
jgi:transposase